MKLAFYKAFQKKPEDETYARYVRRLWLDWAIAILSFGKHSHVEIVDGDDWFSISPRTGKAEKRHITPKEGRWDILELQLDDEDIDTIKAKIQRYIGYKYDYLGAVFSVTPFCIQKDSKIFCSEAGVDILNQTKRYSFLGDGCKYSPSRMYSSIRKRINSK